MEFTLLGAALVAAAAAAGVLWLEAGRTITAGPEVRLGDRALAATLAGVLAGRLAAMVAGGSNPLTHPADIVIVRAGVPVEGDQPVTVGRPAQPTERGCTPTG